MTIKTKNGQSYQVRVPDKYLTKDKKHLKPGTRNIGTSYQKWKLKATRILEKYGDRNDPDKWWDNLSSKQRRALLARYPNKEVAKKQYLYMSKLG